MKIRRKIAGYNSELYLKSKNGETIKYFCSTSGVDQATADQNVYKRMLWFCRRALNFISTSQAYAIDEEYKRTIKRLGLKSTDFEIIIKKLKLLIVDNSIKVEETEL